MCFSIKLKEGQIHMTNNTFRNSHLFTKNGKFFLFDGDSLRLFELDQKNYTVLQNAYETGQLSEIDSELLCELKEANLIIDQNEYENEIIGIQNSGNTANITNLTLCVSNDCNLNCKYCFGDGGTYQNDRMLMTYETAKKCVDFLVSHSGNQKKLTIVFFGGEPLLNFDVMKKVTDYCHSIENNSDKFFKFSISTNGTIINDEVINFIKTNKIGITLSIDGPKEVNDRHRCYENGYGSYDRIRINVKKMLEESVGPINARATICKTEPDVSKIENGLRPLGFNSIHMTLVDTHHESQLYMDDVAVQQAIEGYAKLAIDYINDIKAGKTDRTKTFDDILYVLFNKKLKLRSCNLAVSSIAINFKGDIYPCHRFMGDEDYIIGSLDNGLIEEQIRQFRDVNVLNIEGCSNCWARFLCAGSCAHSRVKHVNLNGAYDRFCTLNKSIYEIALYIYSELKAYNEDVFNLLFLNEN